MRHNKKPYLSIRTHWGVSPSFIADFVAAYYAVISSYTTHWHIIMIDSEKLKLVQSLPRGKQWKSAAHLVGMRRWLEEGLRLASINNRVKLGMFNKFPSQLVKQQAPLTNIRILDLWVRPPDHIDMVLGGGGLSGIGYISQKAETLAEKFKWKEKDCDVIRERLFNVRARLFSKILKATKYEYIPRMRVLPQFFDIYVSSQEFSYKELETLFSSQTGSEKISRSLVVKGTDLTFEHFGFDENLDNPKALSSLVLYTIEFGKFMIRVHDPNLEIRQQKFVVKDFEGKEWEYIASEPDVRLLNPGGYIAILAKRIWCQNQVFCLKKWNITDDEYQQAQNIVINNDAKFSNIYQTVSQEKLLKSLHSTEEVRLIGDLPIGIEIFHSGHGKGRIIEKKNVSGQKMIEVQFKQLTDFIPVDTPVMVSWE